MLVSFILKINITASPYPCQSPCLAYVVQSLAEEKYVYGVCMSAHYCICVCMCLHACMCICMYVYLLCSCVCTCVYVWIYRCIYSALMWYIYTYIYTYTYTVCVCVYISRSVSGVWDSQQDSIGAGEEQANRIIWLRRWLSQRTRNQFLSPCQAAHDCL